MRSKKFEVATGADFISSVSLLKLSIFNPANPLLPATDEIVDLPWRARVAIRRLVRVSTTLSHQLARTDNDKVAREHNEVARREMDCSPEARVCRDHCAEVSRQNAASTDTPQATPS